MATLSSAPLTATINTGPTVDGNALAQASDLSPLDTLIAIQGAQEYLRLYFAATGGGLGATPVNQRLAAGVVVTFTGKAADNTAAGTLLFQAVDFVEAQDAGGLYYYQAFLDLDTTEIATAFGLIDGDTLDCAVDLDLAVAAAGATPALLGIYRLAVRLLRQVYTGSESAPTPATPAYPPPASVQTIVGSLNYLPALTGLTGGGAANLDGLATAALPTYYALLVVTFAGAFLARLELDSDAAGTAQVIVPPDHDALANPRSWRIRL